MGRCIRLLAVFPFLRCPVLPLHLQICIRYFISQRNWKLHYFLMLLENIASFPFKNAIRMAISSLLFVSSWLFGGNGHCNPCLRSPNRVGFTLWGWKVSTVMRKLPAKLRAEFKHYLDHDARACMARWQTLIIEEVSPHPSQGQHILAT